MKMANSFDEMHQNIGREEGKQEPKRTVSKGETALQPRELLHFPDCFIKVFREKTQTEKCQDEADDAPGKVRHKEATDAVLKVRKCFASNAFVEIPGLEEEKAHEEECPKHYLLPPRRLPELRLTDGVKRYHSDNTQSTQQVEGIIARLQLFLY